ncbi:hypothetical protein IOK49_05535 [Fervidicoccus fontis]|uniref:Uncharacterized protein n=1 Tax=Fervidicoccus fontis TaxID=683846 RepID=A0A7C2ZN05_9CREN|nr:hypothetical protein [Fervidicoccus fontis]MBE9391530.1 hypothetical protein [Fervidicoccus fontis]PMB77201.1 MAG: hypothetical protein C0177_03975 [Fervidicoccus fontis]HEW63596.1 hypothetical protein [Fervidicoccus fontis]
MVMVIGIAIFILGVILMFFSVRNKGLSFFAFLAFGCLLAYIGGHIAIVGAFSLSNKRGAGNS